MNNKLIVFEDKLIWRVWHNDEWFYSVNDIVAVLTESKDEMAYWRKLKQREPQLVTFCHGLKLQAKDGGNIAKITRKELEKQTGKSVISKKNYLHLTKKKRSNKLEKRWPLFSLLDCWV